MGDKSKMYFDANPNWYAVKLAHLSTFSHNKEEHPEKKLSELEITKKYEQAKQLLHQENTLFEKKKSLLASDRAFYTAMLKSGTLNDKISALSVLVSASPMHGVKALDTLMGMAKKNNRHESTQTIVSLREVIVESLLPRRKLKYFRDQPLADPEVTPQHLIVWAFEDYLKKYYFELIQIIEALSHDVLTHIRQRMVETTFRLVKDKPEQEQNLLKLLVNKLGDAEKKVASKTSYLIRQLLSQRPKMKLATIREIEQFLLLSYSKSHGQYYALITLNQMTLVKSEVEFANKLVDIYFIFFRKLLGVKKNQEKSTIRSGRENSKKAKGKKNIIGTIGKRTGSDEDIINSKMIVAVLTGVNRAFPYAKVEENVYNENLDVLFRITYSGTFSTSVHALMLIFQVCSAKEEISDRFYRSLYESLLDNRLATSSKHAMYLNLLFKALKADEAFTRVKAFVKRILQIAAHSQPPFICGVFHLLSELIKVKPGLRALIIQPEERDEEHFVDVSDEDEIAEKGQPSQQMSQTQDNSRKYDGRKRDPQYSDADQTCLWELCSFSHHFHPSVALYANQLLEGIPTNTQPELHLHTLSHFLDRFVYRNPKKKDGNTKKGSSTSALLTMKKGGGIGKDEVVNSEEFWRRKVEAVPVDQIFFHKYFTQKHATDGVSQKKSKKTVEDGGFFDDETSEEEEEEIWRVMSEGLPNVNLGADENSDELEFSDENEGEHIEKVQDPFEDSDDDGDDVDYDKDFTEEDDDYDKDSEDGDDLASQDSDDDDDESKKRKYKKGGQAKTKRRKLNLPTFASFEEYAEMLDD